MTTGQVAAWIGVGISVIGLLGTLVTAGIRIGSLTTEISGQNTEIGRLNEEILRLRNDVQSLERYLLDWNAAARGGP